jgi:phytoene synthase
VVSFEGRGSRREDRTIARAYAACERLARAHYENFPVASRLLPPRMRPHIAAIYAFARTADDFADEGHREPAARLADLDAWGARLHAAAVDDPGSDVHADVFAALADTIARFALPVVLFDDLLDAFRQDVTKARYDTWQDVLDYCRRSANPVGRLVLRVAGYADPQRDRWSDAVCTALQLTNFWQDLARDWDKGRLYVPQEIARPIGAREEDLARGVLTPRWREALAECARRTRALFDAGRPVCDSVAGRLRWELRATWLGGTRILERVARAEYDVVHQRPSLSFADAPVLLWRLARWHRDGSAAGG